MSLKYENLFACKARFMFSYLSKIICIKYPNQDPKNILQNFNEYDDFKFALRFLAAVSQKMM